MAQKNSTTNKLVSNREHGVDILKGLSILMVISTHYDWELSQRNLLLFPFWIDMAVPIFMIISGYVYAMSYLHRGYEDLRSIYNFKDIWKKFIRYTSPFLIAFFLGEVVALFYYKSFSLHKTIVSLITGGRGPGSYYYPVMCQFILLFPIIYIIIKKYRDKGVFICLLLNALYELIKAACGLPTGIYRLLALRYIFLMAFGCYFYLYGRDKKLTVLRSVVCLLIGIFWEILVSYTDYTTIIINNAWAGTSFMCGFYIIPIFVWMYYTGKRWRFNLLENLGKASFHIFLVQMVYFVIIDDFVYTLIPNILGRTLVNLLVCCVVGYVFYKIEKPIGDFLYNKTLPLAERILGWRRQKIRDVNN